MAFRENVALNYSAKEMQKMFEAKCPRGRKTRTPRARKKAVGMQWTSLAPVTKDQEDSEEEEEAFAAADTYTNYTPAKSEYIRYMHCLATATVPSYRTHVHACECLDIV